jgi:hypothetical protein
LIVMVSGNSHRTTSHQVVQNREQCWRNESSRAAEDRLNSSQSDVEVNTTTIIRRGSVKAISPLPHQVVDDNLTSDIVPVLAANRDLTRARPKTATNPVIGLSRTSVVRGRNRW